MPGIHHPHIGIYDSREIEILEEDIGIRRRRRGDGLDFEDEESPEFIFGDSFFQFLDDVSSVLRVIIIVCLDVCPVVTVIFDVLFICQHQGDWRALW